MEICTICIWEKICEDCIRQFKISPYEVPNDL